MKLNEILTAITKDLDDAGVPREAGTLSLGFTAKRAADGTVTCDYIDASVISKPRAEEIHRIVVNMKTRETAPRPTPPPPTPPKESDRPPKTSGKTKAPKNVGNPLLNDGAFDRPAIHRKLFTRVEPVKAATS